MRMIVIKQATDRQALGNQLLVSAAGNEGALERIELLNPHVDFGRIAAGTVLFVPDLPGLKAGASASVGGQAFDAFRDQVGASLDAVAAQVRKGYATLASERNDVMTVLKGAVVRRLLESDPDLRPQLDAAAQVFKQDQQNAKDAEVMLKTLQQGALTELDVLAKLLA